MRRNWLASASLVFLASGGCSNILGITDVPAEPQDSATSFDADAAIDTAEVAVDAPMTTGPRPPARPSANSSDTFKQLVFAIRRFHFGQNDLGDPKTKDPLAWKKLGFDIDGVQTTRAMATAGMPGTCKAAGATSAILEDGDLGRDNSFGANLFPQINAIGSGNIEAVIQTGIDAGNTPTIVFALSDVNDGPNDTFVSAAMYLTKVQSPPVPPAWDGNDQFVVDQLSLKTTMVNDPKLRLPTGYIAGDTYVSGDFNSTGGDYVFYLPLGTLGFVSVNFVSLTMVIQLDPKHEKALKATVVGVIEPKWLDSILEVISATYLSCNTAATAGLRKKIFEACDLSLGKPNFLDPTGMSECDAISIAIDVDLEPVQIPTSSAPPVVGPHCDDAGAD